MNKFSLDTILAKIDYKDMMKALAEEINFDDYSIQNILLFLKYYKYYRLRDILKDEYRKEIEAKLKIFEKIKRSISKHFQQIPIDTIMDDLKYICSVKKYDFIDLYFDSLVEYKCLSNICFDDFYDVFKANNLNLSIILKREKIFKLYETELHKLIFSFANAIELLVCKYDEGMDYNVPKYGVDEIDVMITKYLCYEHCNLNYLNNLLLHKNSKDSYIITPLSKTKILEKKKIMENNILTNNLLEVCFNVAIIPSQEEISIISSNHNEYVYNYSGKWIDNNLDYPTLLNNLIYMFEFTDLNLRFNDMYNQNLESEILLAFENHPNNYYGSMHFNTMQKINDMKFRAYYEYLKKKNIHLENLISWFVNDYINDEFSIYGFNISLSSSTKINLENCIHIYDVIESLLKQFYIYAINGVVNKELFEYTPSPSINEIPSLLKNKYCVLERTNNEFNDCLYLLFNDQSGLVFLEDYKYTTFFELIVKEKIKREDYTDFEKVNVDILIKNGIIYVDNNGILTISNLKNVKFLFELYKYGYVQLAYLDAIDSKYCEFLLSKGYCKYYNKLFSHQEYEYLSYCLNDQLYVNALALRNKYSHGTYGISEEEIHSDYLLGLRIICLIIIKINGEFCLKNKNK